MIPRIKMHDRIFYCVSHGTNSCVRISKRIFLTNSVLCENENISFLGFNFFAIAWDPLRKFYLRLTFDLHVACIKSYIIDWPSQTTELLMDNLCVLIILSFLFCIYFRYFFRLIIIVIELWSLPIRLLCRNNAYR